MLSISHLSKNFGTKKVLKDISINVRPGEIALLLGASGSGKSTLLRILNNLETKDAGTITLNDKELDLSQINRNHLIGMVFQQFNLFEHMTVLENITFPLEHGLNKSHPDAVREALDLLRSYNLADKVDEYVSQLSGGQKQRLALARTLALKPRVICLDEPTSALDPLLTSYVADSIQRLADEGYIVLVASHDTKLIERLKCTIYLLEEGDIVESAASQEYHAIPQTFGKINNFIKGHA